MLTAPEWHAGPPPQSRWIWLAERKYPARGGGWYDPCVVFYDAETGTLERHVGRHTDSVEVWDEESRWLPCDPPAVPGEVPC